MNLSPQHDPTTTPDDVAEHRSRTALVLGGGGSAGNAWLIGVIAGLGAGGLDVTEADLIVGTSAGSTAAAQISGATPAELLAATVAVPPPPPAGPAGAQGRPAPLGPAASHVEMVQAVADAASDPADMRRRMAAVLEASPSSDSSSNARWRATVAARLPRQDWPNRRMLITAVDAGSGDPVVFDRRSGVDLVDAVAASCAGGFAYGIGVRRYIDGGYRANADNADLAAGYARVLVLSPLGGRSLTPVEWGTHLATQVDHLRAHGSRVETVFPDGNALTAFGDNLMDHSRRPAAARAGYDQGLALVEQLSQLWR